MISKYLTIVAAVMLISGSALAQDNSATAPASSTPAAAAPDAAPAPAAPAAAPDVKAPSPAPTAATANPYGLGHIIEQKNPVSLTILAILAIMSAGTWYIFFVKFLEQGRILSQ